MSKIDTLRKDFGRYMEQRAEHREIHRKLKSDDFDLV
jgi:hypothetical protein